MRLDTLDQPIYIAVKIGIGPHLNPVAVRERAQRRRQCLFSGDRRPTNQHRDDRYVSTQRQLEFEPHVVARIVDSSLALLAPHPLVADDGDQYAALAQSLFQVLPEIDAKRNRIDVLEDDVPGKMLDQPVVNPAGDIRAVVTPVRYKHAAGNSMAAPEARLVLSAG